MKRLGKTPPFGGPRGEILPGGIADIRYLRLGGLDHWVMMRGENEANPLLIRRRVFFANAASDRHHVWPYPLSLCSPYSFLQTGCYSGIQDRKFLNGELSNLLLQQASELAIRATLFLARQAPGKLSPVHEIASHYGVSKAYLAKILQRLAGCGLVRSFRGPGKGMELARAPHAISLAAVISAVEGPKELKNCVLGLGLCSEDNPCVLHKDWLPLRTAIHNFLEKTTLADLANVIEWRPANPGSRFVGQRREIAHVRDTLERKRQ